MISVSSLEKLKQKALKDFAQARDTASLEKVHILYLGRKSELTQALRSIKDIPPKKRKEIGKKSNNIKKELEKVFLRTKNAISLTQDIEKNKDFDVTAPGQKSTLGHIHLLTQMRWRAEEIFERMGFEIFESYEIDDDYHNFVSLNIPEGHPARDIWDTFWTLDNQLAITQTSSMQNRILKSRKPPIRAIVPGKVFRNERTDPRHEHTLYQFEGIYVDKGITLADMIGTLKTFFNAFFEKKIELQVTPDYFPFVEPGNGVALSCFICNMKGCRVCKYSGWLEVLGCGMIHPNVLREGGIDPDQYSGFAWGFGLERITMLKYGIEDIRHFHSGDLRFIQQF